MWCSSNLHIGHDQSKAVTFYFVTSHKSACVALPQIQVTFMMLINLNQLLKSLYGLYYNPQIDKTLLGEVPVTQL